MKNLVLTLMICLLAGQSGFSQNAFLASLNKEVRFPENYYHNYLWQDFLTGNLADKTVDLHAFDHNLFNAAVFFLINQFRNEGTLEPLHYSPGFESVAYNYLYYFPQEVIAEKAGNPHSQSDLLAALNIFEFNGAYAQMLAATTISGAKTTYLSLAREVVLNFKNRNADVLRQPVFSNIGIRSILDTETKFITTMIIFGGHRLSWLEKE